MFVYRFLSRWLVVALIALIGLQLVPVSPLDAKSTSCCVGTVGNADGDFSDQVDIGDLVFLVDHLFITFVSLPCPVEGDVDGVTGIDIGDLIFLVDNLFISFQSLPDCPSGGGTTPEVGDLVITEIMIDPTNVADPNGEWFEVVCFADTAIELQGVLFKGATAADTFRVTSSLVAEPGDFITFARSASPGFTPDYVYGNMNLDNGSDKIDMSYNATLLDAVTWTTATAGASRTLILTAYSQILNDADSAWCDNIVPFLSGDLGTPGFPGVTACEDFFTPLTPGAVLITEFMPNPTDLDDAMGEWFEIYNPSLTEIYTLQGAVFKASATDSFVISSPVFIGPGEYLVCGRSIDAGLYSEIVYAGLSQPNTGSGSISIYYGGVLIDMASYSNPTANTSRALDPTKLTATDNDNLANWCDAVMQYDFTDRGTPGFENEDCTP